MAGCPSIENEILTYGCLLCTKRYYEGRELRAHYARRHAISIAPEDDLPEDRRELRALLAPPPDTREDPPTPPDTLVIISGIYAEAMDHSRRLTRAKRALTETPLDPGGRDWPQCQKCPRLEWHERGLRRHYAKAHGLHLGLAPLPKTLSEIEEFERLLRELPRVNTRCGVCGHLAGTRLGLTEHLATLHVPDNFKRHRCRTCLAKFVSERQLRKHFCLDISKIF